MTRGSDVSDRVQSTWTEENQTKKRQGRTLPAVRAPKSLPILTSSDFVTPKGLVVEALTQKWQGRTLPTVS